ncbi:MAG: beta strand repeat-containing protein, partial [Limisphaerales bacterium]
VFTTTLSSTTAQASDTITASEGTAQETTSVTFIPDTWTGTGDWFDGTHWSGGSPPGPALQAAIAAGANPALNSNYTLDGVTLQNGGRIDVGVTSGTILSLDNGTTIAGGTLSIDSLGTLDNITGSNTISGAVVNDGTIEVIGGSLILSGGLSGPGSVIVDGGATLELSGTSGNPANVTLNPSGSIVGATNGIEVVQDGYGDLTINESGSVVGQAGDGLIAEQSATGVGNIVVDALGSLTGTGPTSIGLLAENLNTGGSGDVMVTASNVTGGNWGISAENDGSGDVSVTVAGTIQTDVRNGQYGVRALSVGSGNVSVLMNSGTIISGGSGIAASNRASTIAASLNSTITVTATGSINSHNTNNLSGSVPSGVVAGYNGTNVNFGSVANTNVNGTVVVNISGNANITATAGYGIDAYNFGNGDVTVNDALNDTQNTIVTGVQYGIAGYAESGGTGSVVINVGSNATINSTGASLGFGIFAFNTNTGVSSSGPVVPNSANITINTSAIINSTGAGIVAVNEANVVSTVAISKISVTNHGNIVSGSDLTGTGSLPAGILAGYLGGSAIPTNTGVPLSGLYGDVIVNNFGNITAAAGDGIRAYNWGTGTITVNDYAGTISAMSNGATPTNGYGNGIVASNLGPGDIEINTNFTASEVTQAAAVVINSLSSGVHAFDTATTVAPGQEIRVVAYGTINSGNLPDDSAGTSITAGIHAGYSFNNSPEPGVAGDVFIDDHASIFAASGTDGIRGYNYGVGRVDIVAEAGAVITVDPVHGGSLRFGVFAFGDDGGNVSITNYASVTATTAIEATTTGAGTSTIDNHGQITGAVVAYNAAFTNELDGVWNLNGNSAFSGTSVITNTGTIDASGSAHLSNSGTLTTANTGTIEVHSGASLVWAGAFSGSGAIDIDNGASLELTTGSSINGQAVVFEGSIGTLKLDNAQVFHATISGFAGDGTLAGSDQIDLVNVNFSLATQSFNSGTNVLTVSDGTHSAILHFNGVYSAASFSLASDGGTGTIVYDPPNIGTAVE